MKTELTEKVGELCEWLPSHFISLVGELAWPLVVLVLGVALRGNIKAALKNFFSKNDVSEISATTSGVVAKFRASKQSEDLKSEERKKLVSSEFKDAESIRNVHEQLKTKQSQVLNDIVVEHVAELNISEAEKIDLLCREVAILQSGLSFLDIKQLLFKSQFDLFNERLYPDNSLSLGEISEYFKELQTINPEGFDGWDVNKYLAYPTSNGLVEVIEEGYKLTTLGESFVLFMRRNPNFIEELANL